MTNETPLAGGTGSPALLPATEAEIQDFFLEIAEACGPETLKYFRQRPEIANKEDAGFDKNMTYDHEAGLIDPRHKDGLYYGPSSGHINADKAEKVGMGGAYGYGASMSAWFHDYVAYWAGHNGFLWHTKSQFRSPAFEGDVTYVDGEVIEKIEKSPYGMPVVVVKVQQSTQSGEVILSANAEVELPF